ncbi:MAG: hypothetical protein IKJ41_09860 [Clostridia bacterium]|nr:hypothetical protein [Clostridia bacterium]
MKKIDSTVKKETLYIFLFTIVLSALMESVYLIIGKWDYSVLLGNILGAVAATANFFIMGLTVQNALGKEEKDAKNLMKLSQSLRMLMLFAVALVGYLVPVFSLVAVVIPFIFPRIAVTLRALFIKNQNK